MKGGSSFFSYRVPDGDFSEILRFSLEAFLRIYQKFGDELLSLMNIFKVLNL